MKRLRKILVGVDLSWGDRFVSEQFSAPKSEAVGQALRLAQLNSASIDSLFSMDLSAKALQLISESRTDKSTRLGEAENRLAERATKTHEAKLAAEGHVAVGKSWLELIRQLLRQQHDLVLVGTHHRGAIQGCFLGSNGIKLLRNYPCAVRVAQPPADQEVDSGPTQPTLLVSSSKAD